MTNAYAQELATLLLNKQYSMLPDLYDDDLCMVINNMLIIQKEDKINPEEAYDSYIAAMSISNMSYCIMSDLTKIAIKEYRINEYTKTPYILAFIKYLMFSPYHSSCFKRVLTDLRDEYKQTDLVNYDEPHLQVALIYIDFVTARTR